MLCPNCGKNNKDSEAFCTNCGAALARVKTQKNVQKAVDAYDKPSGGTSQKNVVSAIIIIFLSLILVITLVLLAPLVMNMLNSSDKSDGGASVQASADDQGSKEADFTANPYYACYRAHSEYVLPNSSSIYLSRTDLKDLTKEELTVALNEIYARHGEQFRDADLQAYFENRSWYAATSSTSQLNTYEIANEILLRVYIAQQNGSFSDPGNPYLHEFTGTDSFAVRNSQNRYLEAEDLKDLNEDQLIIARNEIYARHGYVFNDEELLEYFLQQEWYEPGGKIGDTNEITLSSVEKKNLQILQEAEQILSAMPETDQLNRTLSVTVSSDMFSLKIPAYWKDYAVSETGSNSMTFYEKLSKNNTQYYDGKLISIRVYSLDNNDYQSASYTKLGKLTDDNGTEWEIVALGPTDVRCHTCAAALYSAMSKDLQSIYATITPSEGYTYTPY